MELPAGIRRITTPLPTRPGHVHSYLLPGDDGWTLVDTGIGLPDAQETWKTALDGAEVVRIFVTHFHPDHVGAAADVAELTGAPVFQGELDYSQCELVWANDEWPTRIADWFVTHGVPSEITEELIESGSIYRPFIRYQPNPQLVDDGDRLDGWELVAAPGHADGQLCLLLDDVLVSADHLLGRITPTVGLWPESRPDPLGDFLESLKRTIELAPEIALPGHGDPIAAPGHADGQLCLLKERVLVSADHLLGRISPTVGLWPASRPDPLGDFLESLERTIELEPELALPGHGDPIADPVGRARELIEHHRERLAFAEAALTETPRSAYEVSFDLFGAELKAASRRFAVAETLSHLERLVLEERAERSEDVGIVAYTARQLGRAI